MAEHRGSESLVRRVALDTGCQDPDERLAGLRRGRARVEVALGRGHDVLECVLCEDFLPVEPRSVECTANDICLCGLCSFGHGSVGRRMVVTRCRSLSGDSCRTESRPYRTSNPNSDKAFQFYFQ
jgi:hypothetical protein